MRLELEKRKSLWDSLEELINRRNGMMKRARQAENAQQLLTRVLAGQSLEGFPTGGKGSNTAGGGNSSPVNGSGSGSGSEMDVDDAVLAAVNKLKSDRDRESQLRAELVDLLHEREHLSSTYKWLPLDDTPSSTSSSSSFSSSSSSSSSSTPSSPVPSSSSSSTSSSSSSPIPIRSVSSPIAIGGGGGGGRTTQITSSIPVIASTPQSESFVPISRANGPQSISRLLPPSTISSLSPSVSPSTSSTVTTPERRRDLPSPTSSSSSSSSSPLSAGGSASVPSPQSLQAAKERERNYLIAQAELAIPKLHFDFKGRKVVISARSAVFSAVSPCSPS
jgi:hypothetical protein